MQGQGSALEEIFKEGVRAVDPEKAVQTYVRRHVRGTSCLQETVLMSSVGTKISF